MGNNAHPLDTMEVKFWNKWLFGPPDKSGWVFKLMVDTYLTGFNYITNYVLADSLSTTSLADHIRKGHLFTAFKSLGDAKGFQYYAVNKSDTIGALLGDSIQANQVKTLNVSSPLPGLLKLIHDGKTISIPAGDDYHFVISGPFEKGAYRVEIDLKMQGKYIPWLYSNPVYLY